MLEQTPEITPTARGERKLSSRELEVLEMAALGLTNAEIATRLAITVHAIKFHLASIYRKLGVGNRTEAAVAFLELRHQQSTVI